MNSMFQPEFPITHTDFFSTCQAAANKASICFQHEGFQTAFGEMERGRKTGNTGANNDRINLGARHWFHNGKGILFVTGDWF
jgi:hypothetical protein